MRTSHSPPLPQPTIPHDEVTDVVRGQLSSLGDVGPGGAREQHPEVGIGDGVGSAGVVEQGVMGPQAHDL